jgi:uncharacterized protein YecT (DUF1311 family)
MRQVFKRTLIAMLTLAMGSARAAEEEKPIDCANAVSTYEMNACADKDFTAADAELNRVYAEALKSVPEMATEHPYDAKSWEQALRASQRAWVAFRDAECQNHVAMFWSGGSGATAEIIGCMEEKTKVRIKELKERYEVK